MVCSTAPPFREKSSTISLACDAESHAKPKGLVSLQWHGRSRSIQNSLQLPRFLYWLVRRHVSDTKRSGRSHFFHGRSLLNNLSANTSALTLSSVWSFAVKQWSWCCWRCSSATGELLCPPVEHDCRSSTGTASFLQSFSAASLTVLTLACF